MLSTQADSAITHFAPRALTPGRKTVLTFFGTGLENVSNLWSSIDGATWRVTATDRNAKAKANQVSFEINCPEPVRGVQALQLAGPGGASSFQLILIDELRAGPAEDSHHSRTNAQRITLPAAVDGLLQSEQIDYYVFGAKAGESLSIEVIAQRIGSNMDPVARVYDPQGEVLAFCDDEPGTWRDARFSFTARYSGEYWLGIHDSAFGGGLDYGYRLRLTHDPLIWYTYPLIDPSDVAVSGGAIGSSESREIGSPANPATGPKLTVFPSVGELEPNDQPALAQKLFIPTIINGRIDRGGDTDYFQFAAAKAEKLIFQSGTRSLGSPCDLVLSIHTAEGKIVAQSDPKLATDAAVTNQFNESGNYQLEVQELSGSGISNVPYRIRAKRYESGITVTADENRLEILPGATITLKIQAQRYDDKSQIHFEADPPMKGVVLVDSNLAEGKNSGELRFKADENVTAGEWGHFRIKGISASGSTVGVNTGPALQKAFPLMLQMPDALEGIFSLLIKAK